MSGFTAQRSLPSTRVDRKLIEVLESYLLGVSVPLDDRERTSQLSLLESLQIDITDAAGVETLSSMDEYLAPRFPNQTERISIKRTCFVVGGDSSIRVELVFATQRSSCKVTVSCVSKAARELALGVLERLMSFIKLHPAHNEKFHLPAFWQGVIEGLTRLLFVAIGASYVFFPVFALLGTLLLAVLVIWFMVLPHSRPFIEFDCDRTTRVRATIDWLWKGFWGSILFGVLLGVAWKYIVGTLTS